ncbi:MAG: aspartate carbamoyltransferase regulatory subunit [Candidatus Bathyarchaeia archaeon]|jgi:aspartate carbamoyltransferase regulatory subunit
MSNQEVRISKIKNGTVIDHISNGYALEVIKILGINRLEKRLVTIAINIPSNRLKIKDIVKIEGRALDPREVNKIALVAPRATINVIQNYTVIKKSEVMLPDVIEGIVKCTNSACVTNSNEPIGPKFYVESEEPLQLKCQYCGYILEKADVLQQF